MHRSAGASRHTVLFCREDRARIGSAPGNLSWKGVVDRMPDEPDGFVYIRCGRCSKWQVFEILPLEAA